jgi:hypothetical protein
MSTGKAIGWAVLFAGLLAAGLFGLSIALGCTAGRPAATRTDVYFQSDAGQRVMDAAVGGCTYAGGSHFLMRKFWTPALQGVMRRTSDRAYAAPIAVAAGVAVAALGYAVLFYALLRTHVRLGTLLAFWPVLLLASSQVVACLPDHFALSAGLLPGAYGVYVLAQAGLWNWRWATACLVGFMLLAAGICITNVLWPALLILALVVERYAVPRRWVVRACLAGLFAFAATIAVIHFYGERIPAVWQAKMWLNLRWAEDPAGALTRSLRATIDPIIAPTPRIDTNNFYASEMLTFESPKEPYRLWPYDLARTPAVLAWLVLLALAVRAQAGLPWAVLGLWLLFNVLFHNVWGDELFLYSTHWFWALWLIALRGGGGRRLWLLVPLIAGQVWSLVVIAEMGLSIAQ